MELLLARHGETDWNVQCKIQGSTDIELNEKGIQQAEELGKRLLEEDNQIHRIYTSKLKRAKKTGEIIGNILDVPVKEIDGLEEMSFGLWEGLTWNEIPEQYPKEFEQWYNDRWEMRTPQGECYKDIVIRSVNAIKEMIADVTKFDKASEDQKILIVTHGAVLMSLLAYFAKDDFNEAWKKYKFSNTSAVAISANAFQS